LKSLNYLLAKLEAFLRENVRITGSVSGYWTLLKKNLNVKN